MDRHYKDWFEAMFDLNRNGKLDGAEQALMFQFFADMAREEEQEDEEEDFNLFEDDEDLSLLDDEDLDRFENDDVDLTLLFDDERDSFDEDDGSEDDDDWFGY